MIPLPGASFFYTLLKDMWSWGFPWFRGRRFQLSAKGWTVDRWYHPYEAIEKFLDEDTLWIFKEAQQSESKALSEWAKSSRISNTPEVTEAKEHERALYKQYEDARLLASGLMDNLIPEDLKELLARGDLIARGFREPFSHGAPYLTISRQEWRIMKLVWPDRAEGGGVSYIGLTIGKVGTKSFFWRGR
jgi:hypothetical protein